MKPSKELKDRVLLWAKSFSAGDVLTNLQLYSTQEGVLAIGSDSEEWWENYGTLEKVFKAEIAEMRGFTLTLKNLKAYTSGAAGWAASQVLLTLPGGKEIPMRLTMVFQREGEEWKIVQIHHSAGVKNEDLLGKMLQ